MGTSSPNDEAIRIFYEELCSNLNIDQGTSEEAWMMYETISKKYTLEGNAQHWLCCFLYVVGKKFRMNQPEGQEGNCIPLMQLLRACKLSLVHFLDKAKKCCDMASLGPEFRDRFLSIEANYAVSMVIFNKFRPIFLDMFQRPTSSVGDSQRGQASRPRKPRNTPCTPDQLFVFTWSFFISTKCRIPNIQDDLVNSYHLLLVCCNTVFANAVLADRRDLLNPQFMGLPINFHEKDYVPPHQPPCILGELCRSHDGILSEAKGIKEYHWNKLLDTLLEKNSLKGEANHMGLLDSINFEYNLKSMNKEYEEFVLRGDFDERTFFGAEADSEIGSPVRMVDFSEKMQARKDSLFTFAKETPLTGGYLNKLEPGCRNSPVSTAIESVNKLHAMLNARQDGPCADLQNIFQNCKESPEEAIKARVAEWGEMFINHYTQQNPSAKDDFAKKRLQLGEKLFYYVLEITTVNEQQKGNNAAPALLDNVLYQKALFACSMEVVLFSFNSPRVFPWILKALDLDAYKFFKVIEIMVMATFDKLPRCTIKNLQFIEEQILESMVWVKSSPLWSEIEALNLEVLPLYEDVKLPDEDGAVGLLSPNGRQMHSAVRRVLGQDKIQIRKVTTVNTSSGQQLLLSPQSPRKKLFIESPGGPTKAGQSLLQPPGGAAFAGGNRVAINIQTIQGGDGQRYIPISCVQSGGSVIIQGQPSGNDESKKPRMAGPIAFFLRKVYYLASVRLKALCKMLSLGDIEVQKIWTNLEHSIANHSRSLLMDRHLDQLIMCAIYVICKVTYQNREFRTIMQHYRDLPQSASHVYRDVLLWRKGEKMGKDKVSAEEKRGDLIKFYNNIYVGPMKPFSTRFSDEPNNVDIMSPLPTPKAHIMSPKVRVADTCNLFISSLQRSAPHDSPVKAVGTMAYYFSRSPVETLRQINNMVNVTPGASRVGKRILQEDGDSAEIILGLVPSPPKKSTPVVVQRKIQNLLEDRASKNQE